MTADAYEMDSDRVRDVAGRLRATVSAAHDISGELFRLEFTVQDWDVFDLVRTPNSEFAAEAAQLAQILDLHADLVDAADNGWDMSGMNLLGASLTAMIAELRAGLADGVGSSGNGAELIADLEQIAFDGDVPEMPSGTTNAARWYAANIGGVMLARLTEAQRARFWSQSSPGKRLQIIAQFPGLVALNLLAHGVGLTADELKRLRRANAHPTFTDQRFIDGEVNVNLRVITIELGGGLSLLLTKMSDDTVQMTTIQDVRAGAGIGFTSPNASLSVTGGGIFEAQQRFVFRNEAAAADALDDLYAAVRHDGTSWMYDAHWAQQSFGVTPTAMLAFLGMRAFGPNSGSRTVGEMNRLYQEGGTSTSLGLGNYVEVEADFEGPVGDVAADLSAEAEFRGRLLAYDTDVTHRSNIPGQSGFIVSGVLAGDGRAPLLLPGAPPWPVHASGEIGAIADFSRSDNGTKQASFTVFASGGIGSGGGVRISAVDFDTNVAQYGSYSYQLVVPITDATEQDVARALTDIAVGRFPTESLEALYDRSEANVVVERGLRLTGDADVDTKVVSVEVDSGRSTSAVVTSKHKLPGGDMIDQLEVQRIINAAMANVD